MLEKGDGLGQEKALLPNDLSIDLAFLARKEQGIGGCLKGKEYIMFINMGSELVHCRAV